MPYANFKRCKLGKCTWLFTSCHRISVIIHTSALFSQINYANGNEVPRKMHLISFRWLIDFHHFMALIFHILRASLTGNNCLYTLIIIFLCEMENSSSDFSSSLFHSLNSSHAFLISFKEELNLKFSSFLLSWMKCK